MAAVDDGDSVRTLVTDSEEVLEAVFVVEEDDVVVADIVAVPEMVNVPVLAPEGDCVAVSGLVADEDSLATKEPMRDTVAVTVLEDVTVALIDAFSDTVADTVFVHGAVEVTVADNVSELEAVPVEKEEAVALPEAAALKLGALVDEAVAVAHPVADKRADVTAEFDLIAVVDAVAVGNEDPVPNMVTVSVPVKAGDPELAGVMVSVGVLTAVVEGSRFEADGVNVSILVALPKLVEDPVEVEETLRVIKLVLEEDEVGLDDVDTV